MEEIKNNKPPSTLSMSSPKGMDKIQKILNKLNINEPIEIYTPDIQYKLIFKNKTTNNPL